MAYTTDFSINDTVILTSQNPTAFLTLRYLDASYWFIPDCSIDHSILFVNGIDIDSSSVGIDIALELNPTNYVATFQLFTQAYTNFDVSLYLRRFDTSALLGTPNEIIALTVKNRPNIIPSGTINTFINDSPLIENETSYAILRTNPKFSGNIKIMVDENDNIYLDTFKVSQILSNRLYRKQQVSSNSVYSGDVHDVFNSLPVGELYKLDSQDPLNISIPKIDINQQYSTTYNYGARLLKDDLYIEDYSLLAPLWINSKLPDYFAIFRLDGVYNPETYENPVVLDDLATNYFENSDLIKSWSIKTNKPLGQYLTNHLNELIQNPAPVYLSLNEYDANTWYGIAVNKGIIVGRSEVPYFFNQIASNFTEMNAHVSGGFERQNLLCPNLINLEYVFNDNDASLYSMHRYFGLYLSENELYKIAYYADSSSGSVSILSLDGKDSSTFMHSLVFDGSGNIISTYKNRIFVLNDGDGLTRITNISQINGTDSSKYLNTVQDNIFNIPITKKTFNPFISIKLNIVLDQGDHFRVIKKDASIVWEAYGIGGDILKKGECWGYATVSDTCTNHALIHRIAFSVDGSISDQTIALEKAFDLFSEFEEIPPFRVGIRKSNSFSIILNEDSSANNFMFQRITSNNRVENYEQISLFGVHTTNASDYITLDVDDFYGPVDFEFYGPRKTLFCDFIWTSNYLHSLSSSVIDKIEDFTFYQGLDKWYRKIMDFDVSTQSTNNLYKYVYDPLTLEDNVIVMSNNEIKTINGWWNAYNVKPLSISLMGINPVKDIDYSVYDSSHGVNMTSDYWYQHDYDSSTYQKIIDSSAIITEKNSYIIINGAGSITIDGSTRNFLSPTVSAPFIFNTFDASAYISILQPATLSYNTIDGSLSCISYDSSISEENLYDYYLDYDPLLYFDPTDISTSAGTLKYSLTVPQISKWSGLGNDCRNNPFRLILSNLYKNSSVNNSNFIPMDASNFRNEISYPSYKYLSSGVKNWKDYVYYDLNDVVEYTKNDISTYTTIKKLMFEEPTLDVFSKLMYSNSNDTIGSKTRSSIVYYNEFKQSIDTIFQGLSFSFKVQSIASTLLNIKNYDRFRFSFISTATRNYNNNYPIEIIINENTKTILMIWYQGNDILAYSKRNSSLLPGKSILNANSDNPNFQGFAATDVSKYGYIKIPFYLNTNQNTLTINNIYLNNSAFDASHSSPILQLSHNIKNPTGNIINGFGNNYETTAFNKILIGYSDTVYTTFAKETVYYYNPKPDTIGIGIINHAFKYSSNVNLYNTTACDIDLFKYLIGLQMSENIIYYHIIRGIDIYTSDAYLTPPIILSINSPNNYNINSSNNFYTYNGWYLPKFNNILEFNYNENPNIINIVKKDFILSNTNIDSYNTIPQYWYNKVVTTVSQYDVSIKNAINHIENYNIFKSQWDADYYIKDGSLVDGFAASQELPSFFGSKLIKLPEAIVLDTWDATSTTKLYNNQTITLTFNLSKGIQNLFKNKQEFLNNWDGLPNYSESDIDNYIINTILTYYNISFSKIRLNIYSKNDTNILNYTYSNDMIEVTQNFDSQLSIVNGDYIYQIKITNVYNNYLAYYVKFTLFEI